jgi:hypothetical protein
MRLQPTELQLSAGAGLLACELFDLQPAARPPTSLPEHPHQQAHVPVGDMAGLLHGCSQQLMMLLHALYEELKLDLCR